MAALDSVCSAVACVVVFATSDVLYCSTIDFYRSIGFESVAKFTHKDISPDRFPEYHRDCVEECWLYFFPQNPDSLSLALKICLLPCETLDTVPLAQITLHTSRLNDVITSMESQGLKFELYPDAEQPLEIHVVDPTGIPVIFTSRISPFSSAKPANVPSIHMKAISSCDSTANPQTGNRKKIGVLTSGGDSPGMNAAVRAVVRMSIARGCDAFAIYEGYDGLVRGGDLIKQLYWDDVRGWLSEGGTLIGTARCAAFRSHEGRLQAAKHLVQSGIDALIVCGGDGSLTGADLFRSEWPSLITELVNNGSLTKDQVEPHKFLTIAGMVGSIDNDMSATDVTIGAYSSLHRICEAVDSIGATAFSHSRAFIVEVMGRHCGWLALTAGISTGADFVFIPERPPVGSAGKTWEDDMCDSIQRRRHRGKRETIIIVAEGAIDAELEPITPGYIKELLVNRLSIDTRVTTLGHTQRGGVPCAFDRILATLQGVEAVEAVLSSTPDTPSPMIGMNENKVTRKALVDAVNQTKAVAEAIGRKDFRRAMELRNTEFEALYDAFKIITLKDYSTMGLPQEKRMRIAIIHIGAPSGGINAATRAAARYCLNRGHTPLAIHNGIPGLVRHESIRELHWLDVDGWTLRGGSEIGTNRDLPEIDYGMTAWLFQKHRIDALLIIGGFEAFTALSQFESHRYAYPAFRIPMVCLPATISNNVPGTEYSLGSDTCLNALVNYCDVIRQSASASRRRVFVVEVQGGNCGYVATLGGLSVGAVAVYTPEEGINLQMLQRDIDHLREGFVSDKGMNRAGKLILRNERASATYTTEVIASIIRDEAKDRFDSRTAVPGHAQQGGIPSPMDRVRATRLAVKSIQFLEEKYDLEFGKDESSAAVIGIRGSNILFTPVSRLMTLETDKTKRRPKDAWWGQFKGLVDILSGRVCAEFTDQVFELV
ncbi:ATP-dependent 6-phosphofructokinase [Neolecta irregularis DAH-3]|uniref:ATP-dependent 6-phosphofructokinase n=1 Tax=Neolecta irregularis (strain DAH-3) TaxID=1198029 RepID=A0A1U7LHL7_NEOID|nr:ATP-dependent 6-phosphofructokinase [Neolecta irregularis DAH-3]|eukprot:OLL22139.1 ATP-dependent 6-phosphofructokinase [Neolecta irregularis DAH-3]